MLGSVDSISSVRSFPKLRTEAIRELNFPKKKGKFGFSWFDNGNRELHEPTLSFYQNFYGIYSLRVDFNFSKFLYHSNIDLLNLNDIEKVLSLVNNNINKRTGLNFDIFSANTCRIHYAFNQKVATTDVQPIIDYYKNFNVPRMQRGNSYDTTAYLENKSRKICVYDKNNHICQVNPTPELIEKSKGIIRYEYRFENITNVRRFAKRSGFNGVSVCEMVSEKSINTAISELQALLHYDKITHTNKSKFDIICEQTKNANKANRLLRFWEELNYYGDRFYTDTSRHTTKSTYYRNLQELRKLGLNI